MGAITRMDVQSWIRSLVEKGAGASAIKRAYNLTSSIMRAAVDDDVKGRTRRPYRAPTGRRSSRSPVLRPSRIRSRETKRKLWRGVPDRGDALGKGLGC